MCMYHEKASVRNTCAGIFSGLCPAAIPELSVFL